MENKIPLSIGKMKNLPPKAFALVDKENLEDLLKFNWSLSDQGYAWRQFRKEGKIKHERMHRRILNASDGQFCDHINGNRLDNRKENIRICDKIKNGQNSLKRKSQKGKDCTSRFKGVYLHKCGKWHAEITVLKKKRSLGLFKEEWVAAHAYNVAARFHFGEFARLNTW